MDSVAHIQRRGTDVHLEGESRKLFTGPCRSQIFIVSNIALTPHDSQSRESANPYWEEWGRDQYELMAPFESLLSIAMPVSFVNHFCT